jgi:hypothetical protein
MFQGQFIQGCFREKTIGDLSGTIHYKMIQRQCFKENPFREVSRDIATDNWDYF